MKKLPLLSLAVVVAACGDTSNGGSRSSSEVEALCREYCSAESGCNDDSRVSPASCLTDCTTEYTACDDLDLDFKQCLLDVECNDEFQDCAIHQEEYNLCISELEALCATCIGTVNGEPVDGRSECMETGGCGVEFDTVERIDFSEGCEGVCELPDECSVQLGIPAPGADCVQSCQAQADLVGLDCLNAIVVSVECLGTCDFESLTEQQILACQSEALAIESACE